MDMWYAFIWRVYNEVGRVEHIIWILKKGHPTWETLGLPLPPFIRLSCVMIPISTQKCNVNVMNYARNTTFGTTLCHSLPLDEL